MLFGEVSYHKINEILNILLSIKSCISSTCTNFAEDRRHLGNSNKFDCARFALSLQKIGGTSAIQANLIAFGLHYLCRERGSIVEFGNDKEDK